MVKSGLISEERSTLFQRGFTLLELMISIMVLSVMMLLSFFCFDATVQSWRAGQEMSDSMAQVDYVMNQIESALRSAYFSTVVKKDDDKGLRLVDEGSEEDATDQLEWMKLGRAFVGRLKAADGKTEIAEMPHRVRIYVDREDKEGKGGGLLAKAWSTDFVDPDDFDIEEDVEPIQISPRVIAMDCKVLKEPPDRNQKEVKWDDVWTSSNALPYKVSVTLYLQPVKEGEDPLVIARDIEIPVWKYSQNPTTDKKGSKKGGSNGKNPGGNRRPNRPGPGGGGMIMPIGGR